MSPEKQDKWAEFRENIAYLNKETDEFIVYLDKELEIDWCTDDDCPRGMDPAVGAISNRVTLLQTLPVDHLSRANIRAARIRLGEGMARALEGDIKAANEILNEAQAFILERAREIAKLWYMGASAGVAVILGAAVPVVLGVLRDSGFLRADSYPDFVVATWGGLFGAIFSVLARGDNSPASASAGPLVNVADGGVRVLTGAAAAIIMLLLVRAQVIVPSLRGAPSIALLAVVAGFSERKIPALMSRMELKIAETSSGNSRVSPSGTKGRKLKAPV